MYYAYEYSYGDIGIMIIRYDHIVIQYDVARCVNNMFLLYDNMTV